MNIEQLRAGVAYVAALLASIHETRGAEPLTEDEQRSWDEGTAYVTESQATIDAFEAREAQTVQLRSLAAAPGATIPGDTREAPQFNIGRTSTADVFDTRSAQELEQRGDTRAAANLLRSQALTAVEQARTANGDAGRERATELLEGPDNSRGQISKHILRYGSPEYIEAFQEYVDNPQGAVPKVLTEARMSMARAMNEGTNASGGFVVPFILDPTVILTNAGAVNPFRQISGSRTTTTNVWHGVTSAGVNAEWIGEASEVTDASPTVAQPSITAYKADAYLQASMELIADSTISGEISMLLADAKARLESAAFATGTGTNQPRGIVTAASGGANSVAGSSGAAGAADLVVADIFALDNALSPRFRPNASFVMNKAIANKVRQLNSLNGTPQNYAFWVDFGGANPSKLIGYNVHEASDMDSTIVSGSTDDVIVLGDFSNYIIVDRLGMEMLYNPMVLGANRRPTGESAWAMFFRTGADTINSGAFKTLRL